MISKTSQDKNVCPRNNPHTAVGNTAQVARMFGLIDSTSIRSIESLVRTILVSTIQDLGASASIVPLIESLIWVFVARLSLKKVMFSTKDFSRFILSMRKTAQRIQKYESVDNDEQTFVKYWLDYHMCHGMRDSAYPKREAWIVDPLFSGWCKRFVLRARCRRDVSFFYSLSKGTKLLWPPLGEERIKTAIAASKENLCAVRGTLPDDLKKIVRETSHEIFFSRKFRPQKFMPSSSSCSQANRREGGALSLYDGLELNSPQFGAASIGKLRAMHLAVESWRSSQYSLAIRETRKLSSDYTSQGYSRIFDVKWMPIMEPAKIRPISIGDGYLYTALQPLQGQMLSAWKVCAYSTMTSDDLTEDVNVLDQKVDESHWCSGDYKSATDLILKDATIQAFSCFEGHPLYDIGYRSLTEGNMLYPDGSREFMLEGQLMGHPLSFPLLCVINLSVYRCALERWVLSDPRVAFRAKRMYHAVIVNGDDILFKAPRTFMPFFYQTASDAGFQISQGKNYVSLDCALINSQLFIRKNGRMIRKGYLNLRLVKGTSLKTGASAATPDQLGRDLAKMVSLCPWTKTCLPAAFNRFKTNFTGWFQPNWYLPVHLGGYGLPMELAPPGLRITRSQREIATRFIADPRMALYRRDGFSLPLADYAGSLAHWQFRIGDYVPESHEYHIDDLEDSWLARIAYAFRAANGSWDHDLDSTFISHYKPQFRLKPMSLETLLLYMNARLFATGLPPCPPLGYIDIYGSFRDLPPEVTTHGVPSDPFLGFAREAFRLSQVKRARKRNLIAALAVAFDPDNVRYVTDTFHNGDSAVAEPIIRAEAYASARLERLGLPRFPLENEKESGAWNLLVKLSQTPEYFMQSRPGRVLSFLSRALDSYYGE